MGVLNMGLRRAGCRFCHITSDAISSINRPSTKYLVAHSSHQNIHYCTGPGMPVTKPNPAN